MITVDGPLSLLKNLKADDIKVSVNLARAKEGRQIFSIRKGRRHRARRAEGGGREARLCGGGAR